MNATILIILALVTLAAHIALLFYRMKIINMVKRQIEQERKARLDWQKNFEETHESPWKIHRKVHSA